MCPPTASAGAGPHLGLAPALRVRRSEPRCSVSAEERPTLSCSASLDMSGRVLAPAPEPGQVRARCECHSRGCCLVWWGEVDSREGVDDESVCGWSDGGDR